MMRKTFTILGCAGLMLSLTACEGVDEAFGIARNTPDEFTVLAKAPLSVPPNFQLRPPRPGEPRPQEIEPVNTAREIVFSSKTAPRSDLSGGENVVLARAGALNVDPAIRELVDRENSATVSKKKTFTERVLFWQPGKDKALDDGLDAQEEAERLRTR